MTELARHDPAKAARILKVTRDLVLRHGVRGISVSEIARPAQIGKGTLYLYWRTKEELVAELVARDFLDAADEYLPGLAADAERVRPHRMCWAMLQTVLEHPFARAVQVADVHTIGLLTEREDTRRLLDLLGPGVLSRDLLEVWRAHGLARADWAFADQAYALRAFFAGFFSLATGERAEPVADSRAVFEASVRALLDPPGEVRADVPAAAAEALDLLTRRQGSVRALLSPVDH
ncbi:TetR/AcrR family transcriptional regulator [Amycolatopsis sp. NPDC051903]|uniref:TetR/AcrR family transcriptional regulator n=1 Tax=Amycolatopsis sp. NPDC051903 TaxID=3363936 RepID=UPI0037B07CC1